MLRTIGNFFKQAWNKVAAASVDGLNDELEESANTSDLVDDSFDVAFTSTSGLVKIPPGAATPTNGSRRGSAGFFADSGSEKSSDEQSDEQKDNTLDEQAQAPSALNSGIA